jgi:predicted nucleotidyltransferase
MMSERGNSESNHAVDTPLNIEALVNCLAAQPDVLAAYLFGSYATGKARPESDVDVAVLLSGTDEMERFERRLRLMGEVEEALGRRSADVVVLNDAPPLLAHQVLMHGRLIFERDRAGRVEFEVRTGKIYADLQPMYEYHSHDLFQKIREVGLSGRRRNRQRPDRSQLRAH